MKKAPMKYRQKTKHTGVYQRILEGRTYNGKPDICFDISYKLDSKKVWEKVGLQSEGYSAKLASMVRADRVRSIRHGEELPKKKKGVPYFKDVAEKYIQWTLENKKDQNDISRFKLHLASQFNNKRLNEISTFDVERLRSDLFKKGLSPKTIKHVLSLLGQIINKAILWDFWKGVNPVKGIRMPVVQNQRERFLTYEEANLLLNEIKKVSLQLHDITLLSLHTGLRANEIFSLKKQDIDFHNQIINVSNPKNNENRKAYMTEMVKEMLFKRITHEMNPDDYVFKARSGAKIKKISNEFYRIANRLFNKNIKDRRFRFTFHNIRHTFASWLAIQGESLLTIQQLLGHKTLTMVQRYSHLGPDYKKLATLNLEKAFNSKSKRLKMK